MHVYVRIIYGGAVLEDSGEPRVKNFSSLLSSYLEAPTPVNTPVMMMIYI